MPGLLGDGWDDPRSSAMMALAGGLLQGNMGGGLLGANHAYGEAKQNALKQQYMGAQMSNLQSEVLARQATMKREQDLMDFIKKRQGGGAVVPTAPAPAQMGQLGSGSFGAVAPPAGMPAIPQPQPAAQTADGGGFIQGLSADDAFVLKALGKDPVDVINAFKPKWENVGGNMVNTNDPKFKGGFVPQVKFDEKGGATMLSPGANGVPQASVVPGSLEAYGAFRNLDAGINARNELVKVVGPDGAERYVPKSTVLGGATTSATSPRVDMNAGNADRFAILSQELERAKASGNQADVAALTAEIGRLPASARTGTNPSGLSVPGFQATPTTAQAANAVATKTNAEQVAKDIAEQRKGIMNAGFNAPSNIARYQQIGKLLQDVDGGALTPSGTHLASLANSLGLKIDKSLPNKEAAASLANAAALELRNPAGGAGMPGAMSDADRNFLASMTPNMAQSAQGRKQVIDAYVSMQQRNQQVSSFARKYEGKYGRLDNGFFDQLQQWSNANPLFKAQ